MDDKLMSSNIYIDATFGISGDMLVGACLDLGVPLEYLTDMVNLIMPNKVKLRSEKVSRNHVTATKFYVDLLNENPKDQSWLQIRGAIDNSAIPEVIRIEVVKVFSLLAEAEAKIHGIKIDDVRFHEVGAADSICDIVCTCACFFYLKIANLYCGTIEVGQGVVKTEHGIMSIPAPATLELLRNWKFSSNFTGECATPTGVAIVKSLASQMSSIDSAKIISVGYGAGGRDTSDHANVLRVLCLDNVSEVNSMEVVLEANIDDMDPRIWPILLADCLEAGAKDAWVTPVIMKKGRPAGVLSVLCKVEIQNEIEELIFSTTSTIGLRVSKVEKRELSRILKEIVVFGKPLVLKISIIDNCIVNVSQEFDDAVRISKEVRVPVKVVLDMAKAVAIEAGYEVGSVVI
jgi:uncharacterized protein (TIGR00299 family) protein